MMSSDILLDKKCIHVKLDKDTHGALRAKLFKHNITMQDLFEECARLVATETAKGQNIVDSIVNRKIKEAISGVKKKKQIIVSDMEAEALYNMINASTKET
jgi:hypothetical protein